MKKIAVVAIGGNSLIKEGGGISFADQLNTVYETCENLVAIIENGYELLITHGNGPQVGYLLLKNHLARKFSARRTVRFC
jgi:carbamate kinase